MRLLIKQVFDARLDLNEADENWIVNISEQYSLTIRRKHIGRLMRCARELFILDEDIAA